LGIAWAVVEHISNPKLLGAKTLFATHYHELTELEGKLDSVNNYCIAVKEQGDDIIFLRKIVKGGADKSYGIQVAKLAGVPAGVLKRAYEIVDELSSNDLTEKEKGMKALKGKSTKEVLKDTIVKETMLKEHMVTMEVQSKAERKSMSGQLSIFDYNPNDEIIDEIKRLNLNSLTPMEAMNHLYQLQQKVLTKA